MKQFLWNLFIFVKFNFKFDKINLIGIYGKNVDKKLRKKLLKTFAQITTQNIKELCFIEFEKFNPEHSNFSSKMLWVNKKLQILIKRPYIIGNEIKPPKYAIPTLIFKYNSKFWFIQPLVEVSEEIGIEAKRKHEKLMKRPIIELKYFGNDSHDYNWGIWKGEFLKIDW